jgi:hypothetical protein
MRKICAWDVGIKHLAFCILETENDKFKINEWKNIDLTDGNLKKCCATLKKKNKTDTICEAKARFFCERDGKILYYCGSHKGTIVVNIDDIEKEMTIEYDNKTKEKCQHISKKDIQCAKNASSKIEDKIYCANHKSVLVKEKFNNLSVKPLKSKKCTSSDPQDLCNRLYNKLNENLDIYKLLDEVYIENQPAQKNPIMKAVSSMLFSYFVFISQVHNLNLVVKYVSPAVKIEITEGLIKFVEEHIANHDKIKKAGCKCKLCKLNTEITTNKTNFENKYAKYKFSYDSIKELGILYTKYILKENNLTESLDKLKLCDKEDDLCDAFLHGYKKFKGIK